MEEISVQKKEVGVVGNIVTLEVGLVGVVSNIGPRWRHKPVIIPGLQRGGGTPQEFPIVNYIIGLRSQ